MSIIPFEKHFKDGVCVYIVFFYTQTKFLFITIFEKKKKNCYVFKAHYFDIVLNHAGTIIFGMSNFFKEHGID